MVEESGRKKIDRWFRLIVHLIHTAHFTIDPEVPGISDAVELRLEDTDVPALVESVLALQRFKAPQHQLNLQSRLDCPLLLVDADKLHHIVLNLAHHAIKYSPEGGEVIVHA